MSDVALTRTGNLLSFEGAEKLTNSQGSGAEVNGVDDLGYIRAVALNIETFDRHFVDCNECLSWGQHLCDEGEYIVDEIRYYWHHKSASLPRCPAPAGKGRGIAAQVISQVRRLASIGRLSAQVPE